jgi:hypothetical protein
MDVGSRAARDAIAMQAIVEAVGTLSDRFDVPFDSGALRHDPDPLVRSLFVREGIAAWLTDLAARTGPAQTLPEPSERMAVLTVTEVRELVDVTDDPADLDAIEAAERAGPNRTTALAAIERRRARLAADTSEEPDTDPAEDEDEDTDPAEDEDEGTAP